MVSGRFLVNPFSSCMLLCWIRAEDQRVLERTLCFPTMAIHNFYLPSKHCGIGLSLFSAYTYRFLRYIFAPNRWLTPSALAAWYLYAGRRCADTGGIILEAPPYTAGEVALIVRAVGAEKKDCAIGRGRGGRGISIRFSGESAERLWGAIEEHTPLDLREELKPMVVQSGRVKKTEALSQAA